MFYTKLRITDDLSIQLTLYDDEFYTTCMDCEREINLEPEHLADIINNCGFAGTYMKCPDCEVKS